MCAGSPPTVDGMDTITGIPAHPLFVHIPVVLLPLAAVLALVMLIRPTWFDRYKWALLAITSVGTLGAILAAGSGESLAENVKKSGAARQALNDHIEAGDTARLFGIIFFGVIAVWIFLPMYLARRAHAAGSGDGTALGSPRQPKWLRPVIAALIVVTAGAATVTIVQAGHSGAKSVWTEESGG